MAAIAVFITSLLAVFSCRLEAVSSVPVATHVKTNVVHHPSTATGHSVNTGSHTVSHTYMPFGGFPYGNMYGGLYAGGVYGMPGAASVSTGFQPVAPGGTPSISQTTHGAHQPILPFGGLYGGGFYGPIRYPGATFNYPVRLGYGMGGFYGGQYGFNYPGAGSVSHTTHGITPPYFGYGLGIYDSHHAPVTHDVTHTTQHGSPQLGLGWHY